MRVLTGGVERAPARFRRRRRPGCILTRPKKDTGWLKVARPWKRSSSNRSTPFQRCEVHGICADRYLMKEQLQLCLDDKQQEQWPSAVQEFVQSRQERSYQRLGKELGLGADAAKAYAHLVLPQMPFSYLSAARWQEQFGDYFTPEQAEQFEKSLADNYRPYFELKPPTPYKSARIATRDDHDPR